LTEEKDMREAIDRVVHKNKLLAIIIRSDFSKEGIEFFTPNEFSQQICLYEPPCWIQDRSTRP